MLWLGKITPPGSHHLERLFEVGSNQRWPSRKTRRDQGGQWLLVESQGFFACEFFGKEIRKEIPGPEIMSATQDEIYFVASLSFAMQQ